MIILDSTISSVFVQGQAKLQLAMLQMSKKPSDLYVRQLELNKKNSLGSF